MSLVKLQIQIWLPHFQGSLGLRARETLGVMWYQVFASWMKNQSSEKLNNVLKVTSEGSRSK